MNALRDLLPRRVEEPITPILLSPLPSKSRLDFKIRSLTIVLLLLVSSLSLAFTFSVPAVEAASSIGLDGNQSGTWSSGTTIATTTGLTTTQGGDYIIVVTNTFLSSNSITVSSITDASGAVSWQGSARSSRTVCTTTHETTQVEWYGTTSANVKLSTDVITVHLSGTPTAGKITAFGVKGTTGFDTTAGLPFTGVSACSSSTSTPTVSGVSTTNANDFVFSFGGKDTAVTETVGTIGGTTATQIDISSGLAWTEYVVTAAALSSTTCTFATAQSRWGDLCDAMVGKTSYAGNPGTITDTLTPLIKQALAGLGSILNKLVTLVETITGFVPASALLAATENLTPLVSVPILTVSALISAAESLTATATGSLAHYFVTLALGQAIQSGTVQAANPINNAMFAGYQFSMCNANGKYFVFYWQSQTFGAGNLPVYQSASSISGSWSAATSMPGSSENNYFDANWYVYCSGNNVYYASGSSTTIYVNYGTMKYDGTISWQTERSFVDLDGGTAVNLYTFVDPSNVWWVTFSEGSNPYYEESWKCTGVFTSCTWTNTLSASSGGWTSPRFAIANSGPVRIYGSAASLGAETSVFTVGSTSTSNSYSLQIAGNFITIGSNTYGCATAVSGGGLYFLTWSGSAWTETQLDASSHTYACGLATDGANQLVIFESLTTSTTVFTYTSTNLGGSWGAQQASFPNAVPAGNYAGNFGTAPYFIGNMACTSWDTTGGSSKEVFAGCISTTNGEFLFPSISPPTASLSALFSLTASLTPILSTIFATFSVILAVGLPAQSDKAIYTVLNSTNAPTGMGYNMALCNYNGYYWAFMTDYGNLGLGYETATSITGPWSSWNSIGQSGSTLEDYQSVMCHGGNVYYLTGSSSGSTTFHYRWGALGSDGKVSWQIAETSGTAVVAGPFDFSQTFDANGNWWIAYNAYNAGSYIDNIGYCSNPSSCNWSWSEVTGSNSNSYPQIVASGSTTAAKSVLLFDTPYTSGTPTYAEYAWIGSGLYESSESSNSYQSYSRYAQWVYGGSVGVAYGCSAVYSAGYVYFIKYSNPTLATAFNGQPGYFTETNLGSYSSSTCGIAASSDGQTIIIIFTDSALTAVDYVISTNGGSTFSAIKQMEVGNAQTPEYFSTQGVGNGLAGGITHGGTCVQWTEGVTYAASVGCTDEPGSGEFLTGALTAAPSAFQALIQATLSLTETIGGAFQYMAAVAASITNTAQTLIGLTVNVTNIGGGVSSPLSISNDISVNTVVNVAGATPLYPWASRPCYANGNYQVFGYITTSYESWSSSTGSSGWTQHAITTSGGVFASGYAAFWCSGNTVYRIVGTQSSTTVYFDTGSMNSDGTITWGTETSFADNSGGTTSARVSTTVDTNGNWWAGIWYQSGTYSVWECTGPPTCSGGGAWADKSFPANSYAMGSIFAMDNGHVGVIAASATSAAAYVFYTWSGSAWSSGITSTNTCVEHQNGMTAAGDIAYAACTNSGGGGSLYLFKIAYTDSSWTEKQLLSSGDTFTGGAVSADTSGDVILYDSPQGTEMDYWWSKDYGATFGSATAIVTGETAIGNYVAATVGLSASHESFVDWSTDTLTFIRAAGLHVTFSSGAVFGLTLTPIVQGLMAKFYARLSSLLSLASTVIGNTGQFVGTIANTISLTATALGGGLNALTQATLSLTPIVNTLNGLLLAATTSLTSSVTAFIPFTATLPATITLTASNVGQAISTLLPLASVSLTANAILAPLAQFPTTLSLTPFANTLIGIAQTQSLTLTSNLITGSLSALTSVTASLTPIVNQALAGLTFNGILSLTPTITAQAALAYLESVTISLTPTINQALAGIANALNISLTPSVFTNALSALVTKSISLTPTIATIFSYFATVAANLTITSTIQQAITSMISAVTTLTPSLTTIFGQFTTLAASLTVTSAINQMLTTLLSVEIDTAIGLNGFVAFMETLAASINLTPTIMQYITNAMTASLSLTPTLSTLFTQFTTLAASLTLTSNLFNALTSALSTSVALTLNLTTLLSAFSTLAANISISPAIYQAIGGVLASVVATLTPTLTTLFAQFTTLATSLILTPSISNDLTSLTSISVSLTPNLAAVFTQFYTLVASTSLTPAFTTASGILASATTTLTTTLSTLASAFITLAASLTLTPAINQALTLVTSESISLTANLNKLGTFMLSQTLTLTPTFLTGALSALVSSTLNLTAITNQALGIEHDLTITLTPFIAAVAHAMTVIAANLTLTPTTGQGLVNSVTQTLTLNAIQNDGLGVMLPEPTMLDMGMVSGYSNGTNPIYLSTTHPGDLILVYTQSDAYTIVSVTDAAGLTWNQRAYIAGDGNAYEYWAWAPTVLTNDEIKSTFSGADVQHITASAWMNVNPNTPFDPNASLVCGQYDDVHNPWCVVSTTSANTAIVSNMQAECLLVCSPTDTTVTPNGGFTKISMTHYHPSGTDVHASAYYVEASPQTNLNVSFTVTPLGNIQHESDLTDALQGSNPIILTPNLGMAVTAIQALTISLTPIVTAVESFLNTLVATLNLTPNINQDLPSNVFNELVTVTPVQNDGIGVQLPTENMLDMANMAGYTNGTNPVYLTTTHPGDFVLVYTQSDLYTIVSVTDAAGLTWTQRAYLTGDGNAYEYYAWSPGILTNDEIKSTFSGSDNQHITASAWTSVNPLKPFDVNPSLPCNNSGDQSGELRHNSWCIFSVTNNNPTIIENTQLECSAHKCNSANLLISTNSGFQSLGTHYHSSGNDAHSTGYEIKHNPQNDLNASFTFNPTSNVNDWSMLVDALQPANHYVLVPNLAMGLTLTESFPIDLTSALQYLHNFAVEIDALISLIPNNIGQALGILSPSSISLTPVLTSIQGFFATLSATLSLTSFILALTGFFASLSSNISLVSSIGQDLSSVIAAITSIDIDVNQSLDVGVAEFIPLVVGLQATLSTLTGIVLDATENLTSSIATDLTNMFSTTTGLTPFLNQGIGIILGTQNALVVSLQAILATVTGVILNASENLTASITQDLSGLTFAAMTNLTPFVNQGLSIMIGTFSALVVVLSATLTTVTGVLLSASETLTSSVNQALGGITNSYSFGVVPAINQALAGIEQSTFVVVVLTAFVQTALGGLTAALTVSETLTSSITTAISGVTTFVTAISLTPNINQDLGGLAMSATVSLLVTLTTVATFFTVTFNATISLIASTNLGLSLNLTPITTILGSIATCQSPPFNCGGQAVSTILIVGVSNTPPWILGIFVGMAIAAFFGITFARRRGEGGSYEM